MKNAGFLFLTIVILLLPLIACSSRVSTTTPAASTSAALEIELDPLKHLDLFNGKNIAAIRMVYSPEANQQYIEQLFQKTYKTSFKLGSIVYVDSLTDGLLMLRSRKVDALHVMRFTGRFMTQRSDDLMMYVYPDALGTFSTQMIFSAQKQAEFEKVNTTLKEMKEDGTLEKLIAQWITNLPVNQEPGGESMPVIKAANKLKIGISGDEPPLDYSSADGNPGGFNIAVLTEIQKRTNIDLELVTIVGGARYAALQSGKIDAFLWHNVHQYFKAMVEGVTSTPQTIGPAGFYESISYLDDKGSFMVLK